LAFVSVEIVDASGVLVPDADCEVELCLSGPAELAAFGNADPLDVSSLRTDRHKAWRGVLQGIVRPTGGGGKIHLEAHAQGLKSARVQLSVDKQKDCSEELPQILQSTRLPL
jgi:beta-galactosidase